VLFGKDGGYGVAFAEGGDREEDGGGGYFHWGKYRRKRVFLKKEPAQFFLFALGQSGMGKLTISDARA
jgi:hypothetical protein